MGTDTISVAPIKSHGDSEPPNPTGIFSRELLDGTLRFPKKELVLSVTKKRVFMSSNILCIRK